MEAVRHREEEKQRKIDEQQNGGSPTAGSVRNRSSAKSGTNKQVLSKKTYINKNAGPDDE